MFPIGAMHGQGIGPNLLSEAERRRRHSLLRLGLMACFAMLLIDSFRNSNNNKQSLRGIPAKRKEFETISRNDSFILTEALYGCNATRSTVLRDMSTSSDFNDISGVFRGEWTLESSYNTSTLDKVFKYFI